MTALFTLATLALAASFGSWALSRWLSARPAPSSLALVFNGVGVVCLLAAATIAILGASRWRFVDGVPAKEQPPERAIARLPAIDSSLSSAPESPVARSAERVTNQDVPPGDAAPSARSAVLPPLPAAAWDATGCIASKGAESGAPLFLDNECDGVVAIVFARCPHSTPTCHASTLESSGWIYEPEGVVLTTLEQRPLMDRLGEGGPLIAPTYRVAQAEGGQRAQYLACKVREPEALSILATPETVTAERRQRLRTALERDPCYGRVLDLARSGIHTARSPDAVSSGEL